jgi:hypothetical protein
MRYALGNNLVHKFPTMLNGNIQDVTSFSFSEIQFQAGSTVLEPTVSGYKRVLCHRVLILVLTLVLRT